MKATINVSLRIPTAQARLLRRAAEARGMKLATYIRDVAFAAAQHELIGRFLVRGQTPKAS